MVTLCKVVLIQGVTNHIKYNTNQEFVKLSVTWSKVLHKMKCHTIQKCNGGPPVVFVKATFRVHERRLWNFTLCG